MSKGRAVPDLKKLFIIADACVDTGFSRVTHSLIDNLYKRWKIDILAINHYGDTHPIQKLDNVNVWTPTAYQPGDVYGLSRVEKLLKGIQPDVVLVINDPWIAAEYVQPFKDTPGKKLLYTPIDALNIKSMYPEELNKGFDHVIAYTNFGRQELTRAGLKVPTSVIPHGIDKKIFFPLNKSEVRKQAGLSDDLYIVQVVDRNQVRKRVDLALYYFSEWVKRTNKPDNVRFYYHGAMIDEGWDLGQIAKYLGIDNRLILSHQNLNPAHGFPIEAMKMVYGIPDVKLSTCMGEGWGLTTMESMACGIPQAVPNYSALGEWCRDANGTPVVEYTDISPIPFFNTRGLNTIGGVPDMESCISALEKLYQNKEYRDDLAARGYRLVTQPQFEWQNIAREFEKVFSIAQVRKEQKESVDDD